MIEEFGLFFPAVFLCQKIISFSYSIPEANKNRVVQKRNNNFLCIIRSACRCPKWNILAHLIIDSDKHSSIYIYVDMMQLLCNNIDNVLQLRCMMHRKASCSYSFQCKLNFCFSCLCFGFLKIEKPCIG